MGGVRGGGWGRREGQRVVDDRDGEPLHLIRASFVEVHCHRRGASGHARGARSYECRQESDN